MVKAVEILFLTIDPSSSNIWSNKETPSIEIIGSSSASIRNSFNLGSSLISLLRTFTKKNWVSVKIFSESIVKIVEISCLVGWADKISLISSLMSSLNSDDRCSLLMILASLTKDVSLSKCMAAPSPT